MLRGEAILARFAAMATWLLIVSALGARGGVAEYFRGDSARLGVDGGNPGSRPMMEAPDPGDLR